MMGLAQRNYYGKALAELAKTRKDVGRFYRRVDSIA